MGAGSGRLPPGSRPPVAGGAVEERETSSALNEPGSGGSSAPFARCLGFVWYGKRLPLTVVGASGSSKAANCSHSVRPFLAPKRSLNASSSWDSASSRPPPLPKIPPTSEAVEKRSVTFQSSGPCGRPMATYSPGILVGSSRASAMYWLMPAT